ncbi:hypothetical protein BD626DRAFT_549464 [Schizophyllum amplum]|uniref:Protein kinase regulator n=1 Tax=Schizophyllum amplum TaxID=97359 RepID=A0A550C7F1_9AGAR|nr:hypothetical protein BD626DRAFT_549464 [Auriculariopsis ampla]
MDGADSDRHILDWDETDVQAWLKSLGYPQYETQIRENNITGDVLCMLDPEALKAVGVATIGQRLAILKAIYMLKIAHNVPLEPEDYVPPSEVAERGENMTVEKLHKIIKEQGERLEKLYEENKTVRAELHSFQSDFDALRHSLYARPDDGNASPRRGLSVKIGHMTPGASLESPHPSPQLDREVSPAYSHSPPNTQPSPPPPNNQSVRPSAVASTSSAPPPDPVVAPRPTRQDSSDNLKSFKVSLEDPTWKVLPAALKKYRINNDNWQNYAMFICYGSPGNRIERCLSYDEKPLLLFQKLKDAKKNPVFMLKHIKDIRSPIAVAQQKHAARKASSTITESTGALAAPNGTGAQAGSSASKTPVTRHRPPKLEVHDLSTPQAPLTGTSAALGAWPSEGGVSPNTEVGPRLNVSSEDVSGSSLGSHNGKASSTGGRSPPGTADGQGSGSTSGREMPPASSRDVSYAVAIYPYMAEQDDEFDVVVGDTFVILSRSRGWWVVQRDPTGSGVIDPDVSKQGWVPAGCLLETNVPVASAIAEATAATGSNAGSPPPTPSRVQQRTPILPLSIISTSFPGVALMDYAKKGDEELDLAKDDALRVFKRYNHWSYAVKEESGDRGWVPSWYIGKAATPATPGVGGPTANTTSAQQQTIPIEDAPSHMQISPMSSAFPPR